MEEDIPPNAMPVGGNIAMEQDEDMSRITEKKKSGGGILRTGPRNMRTKK